MKSFNKFSKDGRVTLVSIEEFLERSNYNKINRWRYR